MKKILFIFSVLLLSSSLEAQTHNYHFAGNFNEQATQAPALQEVLSCAATSGNFNNQIINTVSGNCSANPSQVFSFTEGGGLSYTNSNFISNTYTIHLFFKFDALSGYQRIIDFRNGTSDNGIYTLGDCLNFYPSGNAGTCPYFTPSNFYLFSIVRDGNTNLVNVYVNGNAFVVNYNDVAGDYAPTTSTSPIIFFKDDNAVSCEDRAGSLKFLSLKNTTSTPAEVQAVVNNICAQVLPLNIISFTGKHIDNTVELKWKTENEINVAQINIEKSYDGQSFESVGNILPTNKLINDYSWIDPMSVSSKKPFIFYRLKLVDLSGAYKYSSIIKMDVTETTGFSFFPNPTKNNINVFNIKPSDVLKIITLEGKTLFTTVAKHNNINLSLLQYPRGTYILQVQNSTGVKNKIVEKL